MKKIFAWIGAFALVLSTGYVVDAQDFLKARAGYFVGSFFGKTATGQPFEVLRASASDGLYVKSPTGVNLAGTGIYIQPVSGGSPTSWSFLSNGTLTQNGTSGSDIVFSKAGTALRLTSANGLTAAGSARTDCLALTATYNTVTTTAASTGVCLFASSGIGSAVVVHNRGANALNVYPESASAAINGGSAGAAVAIAATATAFCMNVAANVWSCSEIPAA